MVEVDLQIGTRQESAGQWVGWCPSLQVGTVASTQDAARDAVREAAILWLETCYGEGTLEAALNELGFRTDEGTRTPAAYDRIRLERGPTHRRPIDYLPSGAVGQGVAAYGTPDVLVAAEGRPPNGDFEDFEYSPVAWSLPTASARDGAIADGPA